MIWRLTVRLQVCSSWHGQLDSDKLVSKSSSAKDPFMFALRYTPTSLEAGDNGTN